MKYEDLINTITSIVGDDTIYKNGLMLVYVLDAENHRIMNETMFYKTNSPTTAFEPSDEFEVQIGDIVVNFIKKIN